MTRKPLIKELFGKQVRFHRKQLGLSQEDLAEMTNLHRNYIGEVERGLRNISLENIYKLSQALGVSMSELLDFE